MSFDHIKEVTVPGGSVSFLVKKLLSRHSHMWLCRDHKLQASEDVSCQFGASSLSSKQAPKLHIRSRTFLEARFESNSSLSFAVLVRVKQVHEP